MHLAEFAECRRLVREGQQGPWQQARARAVAREDARRGTGFEPFLIAAVLGLFLWALILSPLYL